MGRLPARRGHSVTFALRAGDGRPAVPTRQGPDLPPTFATARCCLAA